MRICCMWPLLVTSIVLVARARVDVQLPCDDIQLRSVLYEVCYQGMFAQEVLISGEDCQGDVVSWKPFMDWNNFCWGENGVYYLDIDCRDVGDLEPPMARVFSAEDCDISTMTFEEPVGEGGPECGSGNHEEWGNVCGFFKQGDGCPSSCFGNEDDSDASPCACEVNAQRVARACYEGEYWEAWYSEDADCSCEATGEGIEFTIHIPLSEEHGGLCFFHEEVGMYVKRTCEGVDPFFTYKEAAYADSLCTDELFVLQEPRPATCACTSADRDPRDSARSACKACGATPAFACDGWETCLSYGEHDGVCALDEAEECVCPSGNYMQPAVCVNGQVHDLYYDNSDLATCTDSPLSYTWSMPRQSWASCDQTWVDGVEMYKMEWTCQGLPDGSLGAPVMYYTDSDCTTLAEVFDPVPASGGYCECLGVGAMPESDCHGDCETELCDSEIACTKSEQGARQCSWTGDTCVCQRLKTEGMCSDGQLVNFYHFGYPQEACEEDYTNNSVMVPATPPPCEQVDDAIWEISHYCVGVADGPPMRAQFDDAECTNKIDEEETESPSHCRCMSSEENVDSPCKTCVADDDNCAVSDYCEVNSYCSLSAGTCSCSTGSFMWQEGGDLCLKGMIVSASDFFFDGTTGDCSSLADLVYNEEEMDWKDEASDCFPFHDEDHPSVNSYMEADCRGRPDFSAPISRYFSDDDCQTEEAQVEHEQYATCGCDQQPGESRLLPKPKDADLAECHLYRESCWDDMCRNPGQEEAQVCQCSSDAVVAARFCLDEVYVEAWYTSGTTTDLSGCPPDLSTFDSSATAEIHPAYGSGCFTEWGLHQKWSCAGVADYGHPKRLFFDNPDCTSTSGDSEQTYDSPMCFCTDTPEPTEENCPLCAASDDYTCGPTACTANPACTYSGSTCSCTSNVFILDGRRCYLGKAYDGKHKFLGDPTCGNIASMDWDKWAHDSGECEGPHWENDLYYIDSSCDGVDDGQPAQTVWFADADCSVQVGEPEPHHIDPDGSTCRCDENIEMGDEWSVGSACPAISAENSCEDYPACVEPEGFAASPETDVLLNVRWEWDESADPINTVLSPAGQTSDGAPVWSDGEYWLYYESYCGWSEHMAGWAIIEHQPSLDEDHNRGGFEAGDCSALWSWAADREPPWGTSSWWSDDGGNAYVWIADSSVPYQDKVFCECEGMTGARFCLNNQYVQVWTSGDIDECTANLTSSGSFLMQATGPLAACEFDQQAEFWTKSTCDGVTDFYSPIKAFFSDEDCQTEVMASTSYAVSCVCSALSGPTKEFCPVCEPTADHTCDEASCDANQVCRFSSGTCSCSTGIFKRHQAFCFEEMYYERAYFSGDATCSDGSLVMQDHADRRDTSVEEYCEDNWDLGYETYVLRSQCTGIDDMSPPVNQYFSDPDCTDLIFSAEEESWHEGPMCECSFLDDYIEGQDPLDCGQWKDDGYCSSISPACKGARFEPESEEDDLMIDSDGCSGFEAGGIYEFIGHDANELPVYKHKSEDLWLFYEQSCGVEDDINQWIVGTLEPSLDRTRNLMGSPEDADCPYLAKWQCWDCEEDRAPIGWHYAQYQCGGKDSWEWSSLRLSRVDEFPLECQCTGPTTAQFCLQETFVQAWYDSSGDLDACNAVLQHDPAIGPIEVPLHPDYGSGCFPANMGHDEIVYKMRSCTGVADYSTPTETTFADPQCDTAVSQIAPAPAMCMCTSSEGASPSQCKLCEETTTLQCGEEVCSANPACAFSSSDGCGCRSGTFRRDDQYCFQGSIYHWGVFDDATCSNMYSGLFRLEDAIAYSEDGGSEFDYCSYYDEREGVTYYTTYSDCRGAPDFTRPYTGFFWTSDCSGEPTFVEYDSEPSLCTCGFLQDAPGSSRVNGVDCGAAHTKDGCHIDGCLMPLMQTEERPVGRDVESPFNISGFQCLEQPGDTSYSGTYEFQGYTASAQPYYKLRGGDAWLFYEPDCGYGRSGWVIGAVQPDPTKRSKLMGGNVHECWYHAHRFWLNDEDMPWDLQQWWGKCGQHEEESMSALTGPGPMLPGPKMCDCRHMTTTLFCYQEEWHQAWYEGTNIDDCQADLSSFVSILPRFIHEGQNYMFSSYGELCAPAGDGLYKKRTCSGVTDFLTYQETFYTDEACTEGSEYGGLGSDPSTPSCLCAGNSPPEYEPDDSDRRRRSTYGATCSSCGPSAKFGCTGELACKVSQETIVYDEGWEDLVPRCHWDEESNECGCPTGTYVRYGCINGVVAKLWYDSSVNPDAGDACMNMGEYDYALPVSLFEGAYNCTFDSEMVAYKLNFICDDVADGSPPLTVYFADADCTESITALAQLSYEQECNCSVSTVETDCESCFNEDPLCSTSDACSLNDKCSWVDGACSCATNRFVTSHACYNGQLHYLYFQDAECSAAPTEWVPQAGSNCFPWEDDPDLPDARSADWLSCVGIEDGGLAVPQLFTDDNCQVPYFSIDPEGGGQVCECTHAHPEGTISDCRSCGSDDPLCASEIACTGSEEPCNWKSGACSCDTGVYMAYGLCFGGIPTEYIMFEGDCLTGTVISAEFRSDRDCEWSGDWSPYEEAPYFSSTTCAGVDDLQFPVGAWYRDYTCSGEPYASEGAPPPADSTTAGCSCTLLQGDDLRFCGSGSFGSRDICLGGEVKTRVLHKDTTFEGCLAGEGLEASEFEPYPEYAWYYSCAPNPDAGGDARYMIGYDCSRSPDFTKPVARYFKDPECRQEVYSWQHSHYDVCTCRAACTTYERYTCYDAGMVAREKFRDPLCSEPTGQVVAPAYPINAPMGTCLDWPYGTDPGEVVTWQCMDGSSGWPSYFHYGSENAELCDLVGPFSTDNTGPISDCYCEGQYGAVDVDINTLDLCDGTYSCSTWVYIAAISCDTTWEAHCGDLPAPEGGVATDTLRHWCADECAAQDAGEGSIVVETAKPTIQPTFAPTSPCVGSEVQCDRNMYTNGYFRGTEVVCALPSDLGECCSAEWEVACFDPAGQVTCHYADPSYKDIFQCPLTCADGQQKCKQYQLDEKCYTLSYEDVCQAISTDPDTPTCFQECDPDCETECNDENGARFCKPIRDGACPVFCSPSQTKCWRWYYDDRGYINWNRGGYEVCENVASEDDCPCDPVNEEQCVEVGYYSDGVQWTRPFCQAITQGGCPCASFEKECYITAYFDDGPQGTPDWAGQKTRVCVSDSEPCPCHTTYEDMCGPDDWGNTWCQWQGFGACPVYCDASSEFKCLSYTAYDGSGNPDWESKQESCAPIASGCTCEATWEESCTETTGGTNTHSYCNPKAYGGCPCPDGQRACYENQYDGSGNIISASKASLTKTCVADTDPCPCNTDYESQCGWGAEAFCLAYTSDYECPYKCPPGEFLCVGVAYDSDGYPDLSSPGPEECQTNGLPCPCDSVNEHTCTNDDGQYCKAQVYGQCPVVCSQGEVKCHGYMYNPDGTFVLSKGYPATQEYCASACGCNADHELTCTNDRGGTDCLPENSFSECPLVCVAPEIKCWQDAWTTGGDYNGGEVCADTQSCSTMCGDNAIMCGTGSDAYCIFNGDSCPVRCSETQKMCQVDSFTTAGQWVSFEEACVERVDPCICGDNARPTACSITTGKTTKEYCIPASQSCPLICNTDVQKYCFNKSFTAAGAIDQANYNEYCETIEAPCGCGTNAMRCSTFDPATNVTSEYCKAAEINGVVQSCPVSCMASQKKCNVLHFESTGFPSGSSTVCVASDADCPCGDFAQQCVAPTKTYCLPAINPNTGSPTSCPVFCDALTEEKQFLPNYNSGGEITGNTQVCAVKGSEPDCSLGANAKSCTKEFFNKITGSRETYTECMWTASYCPVLCEDPLITCKPVDNYAANGIFESVTPPADDDKCQSSMTECPCGLGARRCTTTQGGSVKTWCQPSAEPCPLSCSAGLRECKIQNYDTSGSATDVSQVCSSSDAPCPCGDNTERCPADSVCYPSAIYETMCPCTSSQRQCFVENFDLYGQITTVDSVCQSLTEDCSCGENAQSCPGKVVGTFRCLPIGSQDGLGGGCPAPCSELQLSTGFETCRQTNFDDAGNVMSESVTCVALGECQPGAGQKICAATGAMVLTSEECADFYGLAEGGRRLSLGRRLSSLDSDEQETSTAMFSITKSAGFSQSLVSSVKASLDSALQYPATLDSTLSVVDLSTKATMQYSMSNSGATDVTPSEVAAQLRSWLLAQNPLAVDAIAPLGEYIATDGVQITTSSVEVEVIGEVASTTPAPPTHGPTFAPTPPTPHPTNRPTPPTFAPTFRPTVAPTDAPTGPPTQYSEATASVSGDFSISTSDSATFVTQCETDAAVQDALKTVIVNLLNINSVNSDDVDVSCASTRRLESSSFRQLQTAVQVDYTVQTTVADVDSVQAAATSSLSSSADSAAITSLESMLTSELSSVPSVSSISITSVSGGTEPVTQLPEPPVSTTTLGVLEQPEEQSMSVAVGAPLLLTTFVVLFSFFVGAPPKPTRS